MADSSNDSGFLERLKTGARATLERAVGAAERELMNLEQRLQKLAPKLAEPENLDRLQKTMSGAARLVYGLGFSIDADARLLFQFLDWVEQEHGRRPVVEALGRHNPLLDEQFLDLLRFAGGTVSPDDRRRHSAREHIENYRHSAQLEVLRFLASLAALESADQPPVGETPEPFVDFIEQSDIPDRFKRLAHLAHRPEREEPPTPKASPDAPGSESGESAAVGEADSASSSGALGRLRERFDALVQRDAEASALADAVAPLFDDHLRFLSISFLFAAQGFMTRSAIEELPEIVRRSGVSEDDDDVIDV